MKEILNMGIFGFLVAVICVFGLIAILLALIPPPPQLVNTAQPDIVTSANMLEWIFRNIGNWLWHSLFPL